MGTGMDCLFIVFLSVLCGVHQGSGADVLKTGVCNSKVDASFTFLMYTGLSDADFNFQKKIFQEIASRVTFGNDGVLFNLNLFLTDSQTNDFDFNRFSTKEDMMVYVNALTNPSIVRKKRSALSLKFKELLQSSFESGFTEKRGSRPDAKKVMIVFIDSKLQHEQQQIYDLLYSLERTGVTLFLVAVGDQVGNKKWLDTLVTSSRFVLQVDDFSQLSTKLPTLLKIFCPVGPWTSAFTVNGQSGNHTVEKGEPVWIACMSEGNPSPDMSISGKMSDVNFVQQEAKNGVVFESLKLKKVMWRSETLVCSSFNKGFKSHEKTLNIKVKAPIEIVKQKEVLKTTIGRFGSVTVKVKVTSYPEPTMHMVTKDGVKVDPATVTASFEEMDIRYAMVTVTFRDATPQQLVNNYELTIGNGLGVDTVKFKAIKLSEKPTAGSFTVNSKSGDALVDPDEAVVFRCEASGSPPPAISITTYSAAYGSGSTTLVSTVPTTDDVKQAVEWTTTAKNLQSEFFRCIVNNKAGELRLYKAVFVKGAPKLFKMPGTKLDKKPDEKIRTFFGEDGLVNVSVPVLIHPPPTKYTFKNYDDAQSVEIPRSQYDAKFEKIPYVASRITLTFTMPQTRIFSDFHLYIENGIGEPLVVAVRAIKEKAEPIITSLTVNSKPGDQLLEPGSLVRFRCDAQGNPAPVLAITTYGKESKLMVSKIPTDDYVYQTLEWTVKASDLTSEFYHCSASNSLGVNGTYIGAFVRAAPRLLDDNMEAIKAKIEDNGMTSVKATLISHPKPTTFTLNSQVVDDGVVKYLTIPSENYHVDTEKTEDKKTVLKLHINVPQTRLVNDYRLKVDNGVGQPLVLPIQVVKTNVTPEVTEFTVNSQTGSISVDEGTLVRFVCHAKGNPGADLGIWAWKSGRNLFNQPHKGKSFAQYVDWTTTLTAHQSDTYKCFASNSAGMGYKRVDVLVRGPPQFHDKNQEKAKATINADGTMELKLHIVSHPAPTSYTLQRYYQDASGNTQHETITKGNYQFTFNNSRIQYGVGKLKFNLPPYRDLNEYLLTLENGIGKPLKVKILASLEARSASKSSSTSAAVVAGSTVGGVVGVIVLAAIVFALYKVFTSKHGDEKRRRSDKTNLAFDNGFSQSSSSGRKFSQQPSMPSFHQPRLSLR